MTQGWVVNGVRRHAEPLGDNDPLQLYLKYSDSEYFFNKGLQESAMYTMCFLTPLRNLLKYRRVLPTLNEDVPPTQ